MGLKQKSRLLNDAVVGDSAIQRRLLGVLCEVENARDTSLVLLAADAPPILPDPLPSELAGSVSDEASLPLESLDEELVLASPVGITGPTFDASVLPTTEEQAHFHRNLAAVTAAMAGMG